MSLTLVCVGHSMKTIFTLCKFLIFFLLHAIAFIFLFHRFYDSFVHLLLWKYMMTLI